MSDYEHRTGKLRELIPAEEMAKDILEAKGLNIDFQKEGYKSYIHYLSDNFYEEYVQANGRLFKIIENEELDPYGDILEIRQGEQQYDFTFNVRWYNGGVGFEEVIEESFNIFNKKNGI